MIAALPLITSALSILGPGSSVATPATSTSSAAAATGATGTDSFSSILSSFSKDTVSKMKSSEAMSVAGIQGSATTQSVVEAIMQAQEALQTALAVRDKTVAAFQDVTRMSI